MLIAVFADKAPAGMAKSSFPSVEVSDPPDASILLVTGLPTGVPIAVTAGVGSSGPGPADGEEPFLQANVAIRHKDSNKIGIGVKLEDIKKYLVKTTTSGGDSAIE